MMFLKELPKMSSQKSGQIYVSQIDFSKALLVCSLNVNPSALIHLAFSYFGALWWIFPKNVGKKNINVILVFSILNLTCKMYIKEWMFSQFPSTPKIDVGTILRTYVLYNSMNTNIKQ
jgi:hypothetical protein